MKTKKIVLVADNVRSLYNVGSLFRTADAAGAAEIVLVGISPYPMVPGDPRPHHVAKRAAEGIAKTALGAEQTVPFRYFEDLPGAIAALRNEGYKIYALEQAQQAINIFEFTPVLPAALIVGHERDGVGSLNMVDKVLYIPQFGKKESLNVAVAAGIALYRLNGLA